MQKIITLEQAKNLKRGDILYSTVDRNTLGLPKKFKVNGQVKTWKTMPERVKVPLKHGLYVFGYLTEENLKFFSLEDR